MRLESLTPREASIFACVCDTVVAPRPPLPPVAETDAARFLDWWLARSPRINRSALRVLLYAAELAPLALGFGHRLRELPGPERGRALAALESARPALRQPVKLLRSVAYLAYYGDSRVIGLLGYDAGAKVARGRALRAREARP